MTGLNNVGLGTRIDFLHLGNFKLKKVFNFCKKILSSPKPILNYSPLTYYIDISTVCNLRCPHCFQSDYNSAIHIERKFMKYEQFMKILVKIKDSALMLHLYTWGESLLNPDALKMVRAAYDYGIRSRISSHMSIKMSDDYIERLVDSKLHRLTCSIDGPTQGIYEKYRVGGNLGQVLSNVKRILEARKRRAKKYPLMVYRMLVFDWNHEYVEQAKKLADEIGFDAFQVHPGQHNIDGEEVTWNIEYKKWEGAPGRRSELNLFGASSEDIPKAETPCHWLFNNMVITANGKSLACCTIPELSAVEELSLAEHSLHEVWNSEGYARSREYTLGLSQDRSKVMPHCEKCSRL